MSDWWSARSWVMCLPSLALFTVSGFPTDALLSDYSSRELASIGQKTRWLAPPIERKLRSRI
jgi:hypothetical protein